MDGDQRAHGHQPELPERHLARPPGEHGQGQGDDGVDADLAEQDVVADRQDEGQQDGHHDDQPDPRRRDPAAQLVDPARMVVTAPCCQVLRSPVRAPLRRAPTRTSRTTMTTMKTMSCCLAGDGTFHCQQLEEDPHPDAGDEGHGQVDHGADERRRERVEQQVGRQRLGEGAGLVGCVEDGGEGRQRAGHRPGQGRGAADPHPRQAGRVGVLRHGAHGQPPRGEADRQDQGQRSRWGPRSG